MYGDNPRVTFGDSPLYTRGLGLVAFKILSPL